MNRKHAHTAQKTHSMGEDDEFTELNWNHWNINFKWNMQATAVVKIQFIFFVAVCMYFWWYLVSLFGLDQFLELIVLFAFHN